MSRDSLTDQFRAVRDKVRPSGHLSRSKDSSRLNRNDVIHLPSWGVVQVVKNNDTDFYGGEIDTGHRPFLFFHKSQRIGLPGLKIQDARGKSILYIQGENPDSTRPGLRAIEWCFVEDVDWCYSPPPASQEEYDKWRTEILVGIEFNVLLKLIRGELFQRCPDRVQDRVLRVALLQRVKQIAQNRSWARSFLETIEKSPYRDIRVWLLILLEHFDTSDLSVLPCPARYLALIDSENHKSKLIEWGLRRHGDPDFPVWMRHFSNYPNAKLEILGKLLNDEQWRSLLLQEWSKLKPYLPNPASWIHLLPEPQRSAFLEIDDPDLGILKIACQGIAFDLETDGEQIWQIGVAEVGGNKETLYDAKGNTPPLDEALQTRTSSGQYPENMGIP